MKVAKIWIDKDSGRIENFDPILQDWVSSQQLNSISIDDLLVPVSGSSMLDEVKERIKNANLHYIGASSKDQYDFPENFLCMLDSRQEQKQKTIPIILIPIPDHAKNGPEEFVDVPPQLFDSITDFLLICDPQYNIKKANKAAKAVYGGIEDIENKKCYKVLRRKDAPCEDCPLPKTLETGKMVPHEYFSSELKEFLETRTFPNINETGHWTHFTILTRIVSQRREEEGESAQNKKLQALGQMASGVAHDFNNMLTIILGRVQLLKSRIKDVSMMSNLKTIEKAALDSTDIVQRLQDFTRKRNQNDEVHFEPLDVNVIVKDVVSYASTRVDRLRKQEGLRIEIDTQLRDIDKIDGNKTQLRSALLNVIFNAIAAMEIGGVISIWTQQIGSKMEIGISDTGKGMTKEVREKMFDPFFSTKGEKGNGLGLSEVYGIVNQHNGTIQVESTPGEGTTISLYFPVSASSLTSN